MSCIYHIMNLKKILFRGIALFIQSRMAKNRNEFAANNKREERLGCIPCIPCIPTSKKVLKFKSHEIAKTFSVLNAVHLLTKVWALWQIGESFSSLSYQLDVNLCSEEILLHSVRRIVALKTCCEYGRACKYMSFLHGTSHILMFLP